jgi:uncharacterized repeat protein (TIGR03847 family)
VINRPRAGVQTFFQRRLSFMARVEVELDPVSQITIDAIGKPGQRVFYLQAHQDFNQVTILIEKIQVQSLAMGIEQFLQEIRERYPELPNPSSEYDETQMHIEAPVDPIFRAGEISLAFDVDRDQAGLIVNEILADGMEADDARLARFWMTRSQLLAMITWGLEVVAHGRPICPQCGEPMDPEGHFCPKKNGHKH